MLFRRAFFGRTSRCLRRSTMSGLREPLALNPRQTPRLQYPKSRHHALVLARDARLLGPEDLRAEHLPLLRHMRDVGLRWAQQVSSPAGAGRAASGGALPPQPGGQLPPPDFRLGFHSCPSLPQLHLHVVSQDFDSPHLKRKTHYTSFTTDFFLSLDDAVAALSGAEGRLLPEVLRPRKALLGGPLRCLRCGSVLANMPALKAHLTDCASNATACRAAI